MSIRTFIAIDLPPQLKQSAANLQNDLKSRFNCRISWTKPPGMHLTLKFLGDTQSDLIDPLAEAVDSALSSLPSFNLKLTRPGSFGGKAPRVLWIGLTSPNPLFQLRQAVESAVEPFGFPPEKRRFHPHLTLGRVKDPDGTRELLAYLGKVNIESVEFPVEKISFYQSDLKPAGAEYTVLKVFHLSK